MLRMTSVFRSIHKWFEQIPNRICQGPKPSTMHMYFIDWSHTNYDRNSNSGKCRGGNTCTLVSVQMAWYDTFKLRSFIHVKVLIFFPHLRYAVLTTLGSLNLANIWLKSLNFITYIRFFYPSHNLRESGKWGTFLIASVIFCN